MSAKESTPEDAVSTPVPVSVPVQESTTAASTPHDHTSFCVVNNSDLPIMCVLSQLTPMHWAVLPPGEKWYPSCLPVWFTVSCDFYNGTDLPTQTEVAARAMAIVAGTIIGFGVLGFALVGALSGVTSTKSCKKDGILASAGKTIVIKGRTNAAGHEYQLYFYSEEHCNEEGVVSVLLYDDKTTLEQLDSAAHDLGASNSAAQPVEVHDT